VLKSCAKRRAFPVQDVRTMWMVERGIVFPNRRRVIYPSYPHYRDASIHSLSYLLAIARAAFPHFHSNDYYYYLYPFFEKG
jgi:hypothetical protein